MKRLIPYHVKLQWLYNIDTQYHKPKSEQSSSKNNPNNVHNVGLFDFKHSTNNDKNESQRDRPTAQPMHAFIPTHASLVPWKWLKTPSILASHCGQQIPNQKNTWYLKHNCTFAWYNLLKPMDFEMIIRRWNYHGRNYQILHLPMEKDL